jgi:hypothetical protein
MIKLEASVSKGWLNKNGNFTFDKKYYMDSLHRYEVDRKINKFLREKFPTYALYNMEANLVQADFYNENLVQVGAIQPNMILASILGAEFSFFGDQDADVKGNPLMYIKDASELPSVENIFNKQLVKDLVNEIQEVHRKRPDLTVIPPFFWDLSGRATIHGIFTTSVKLVGDNILTMFMIDPDLANAIHQWIVDAYQKLIKYFADLCNIPITSVHVGECSGIMLSSEMYEEFIVPYISQLGKMIGKIRLHSCGKSDYLMESISKIENLQIIDTGEDTSVRKIREIAGPDIEINIYPSVKVLMKDSPLSLVKDWLYRVLEENNNGPIKIAYHLEEAYELKNCLFIHDELERLSLIKTGRLY